MKKILCTLLVIATGLVSEAAAIQWGNDGYFTDSEGTVITANDPGYTFVLVCLGTTEDYSNPEIRSTGGWEAYPSDGENYVSGSYTLNSAKDAAGMIYAVMAKDSSDTLYQLMYTSGSTKDAVIGTYTLDWDGETASKVAGFTFATEGNYTAAPEPTSGLLVLMGLAGLMLRRKRV